METTDNAMDFNDYLSYDPETGDLFWKPDANKSHRWNARWAGKSAGCRKKKHVVIQIYGKFYQAHRVIWHMRTGAWPEGEIDHKDRDGFNNRWDNLRVATPAQNLVNRDFKRGAMRGVTLSKGKYYQAQIGYRGKNIFLGTYKTAEEAHAAYLQKAKELYGEFA